MIRIATITILTAILLPVLATGDPNPPPLRSDARLSYTNPDAAKAARDTLVLLQTDFNTGTMESWTPVDLTAQDGIHWQIDDYLAATLDPSEPDNHAWACNTFQYPVCSPSDSSGGYGNHWYQIIEFETVFETVPGKAMQMAQVEAVCILCPDDDDDKFYVEAEVDGIDDLPRPVDKPVTGNNDFPIDELFSFDLPFPGPGEKAAHTLRVRFYFISDHRGSDEDCEAPAACAALLDNLTVTVNDSIHHVEDCEAGTPVRWVPLLGNAVGDFTKIHTGLYDDDDCAENPTPQVAFIDDDLVVPGTGGSFCWNWCYGPGGYVVNSTGGLAGPDFHIINEIWSPSIPWPGSSYTGGVLEFDVYQHSLPTPNAPGMFYYWKILSSSEVDPPSAPCLWGCEGADRGMVYYGGAGYERVSVEIGDLVAADARWVQVGLGVREIGAIWPGTGADATPAPYFDNFSLMTYTSVGPALWAHPAELAQDAFPPGGTFDHANAAANYVRFDMARAEGGSLEPGVDPGDSIVCTVTPLGAGNSLTGPPVLHYLLKPNAYFDAVRFYPLSGTTNGFAIHNEAGVLIENRWAFDLPDVGLLYPGDRLHYYIRGEQTGGSWATLPADTTGYTEFGLESPYDHLFVVRALPTITDWFQHPLDLNWYPIQPQNLWWNDADDAGAREEWIISMRNLGLVEGVDVDIYETNAPSAGVGNGLGGRAAPNQIVAYDHIMYSAGDHAAFTLGTGEPGGDPGDDVGLLTAHPASCSFLLTGAHWVSDLQRTAAGQAFLANYAGVTLVAPETRTFVGTRLALDVYSPLSGIIEGVSHWSLLGNCWDHEYDAIEASGSGIRFAEYLDVNGDPGAYSLAAWVFTSIPRTFWSFPYDLASILPASDPANRPAGPLATRTLILKGFLGSPTPSGDPSEVPAVEEFRVHPATPNPFNPRTVIRLDLTAPSHVKVELYDLRGRLVRTLEDASHPAGRLPVTWNGADDHGREVAAGVYFCRVQAQGRTEIQKVALIR